MQIAEDMQLIAGHMLMQWLYAQRGTPGGQALNVPRRVLGSSSFAGAAFVDAALSVGHDVLGIQPLGGAFPHLPAVRGNLRAAAYRFRQLDLNTDFEAICTALAEFGPSKSSDFAGQVWSRKASRPGQWYRTNIVSKVRLHEFLRSLRASRSTSRLDTGISAARIR